MNQFKDDKSSLQNQMNSLRDLVDEINDRYKDTTHVMLEKQRLAIDGAIDKINQHTIEHKD